MIWSRMCVGSPLYNECRALVGNRLAFAIFVGMLGSYTLGPIGIPSMQ